MHACEEWERWRMGAMEKGDELTCLPRYVHNERIFSLEDMNTLTLLLLEVKLMN